MFRELAVWLTRSQILPEEWSCCLPLNLGIFLLSLFPSLPSFEEKKARGEEVMFGCSTSVHRRDGSNVGGVGGIGGIGCVALTTISPFFFSPKRFGQNKAYLSWCRVLRPF